jgi:hypothetical protein
MPQAECSPQLPLALRVLVEELGNLEARFDACKSAADSGERAALERDLARDVDRYLRLEDEVFNPVLDRRGIEHADASASHARLRQSLGRWQPNAGDGAIQALHAAVRAHRQEQEERSLPRAARALGDELPGLALELEEVRSRMKGAYGV